MDLRDSALLKESAALRALDLVCDGTWLGLGTGSTAARFVEALGVKVAAGLKVLCVPTSEATRAQAERLTRDMIHKLLHWPTLGIRTLAKDNGSSADRLAWTRSLFGLDRPEGKGEEK